jgi:LmbE family N-acetylglucosaminyl deacetylase
VHKIKSLYYYGSSAEWDKKPDILVDVSDVEKEWETAMAYHVSQMKTKQYSHLVFTKSAALGASMGVKYAVGLYSNDPIRLNALSDLNLSSRNY